LARLHRELPRACAAGGDRLVRAALKRAGSL
jgi:hypothetical protein